MKVLWFHKIPIKRSVLKFFLSELQATRFFFCNVFFLPFSWIELQMLLRCCLINTAISILSHILYLTYLCPRLGLGLFMLYLLDLFFIFSLIFIVINHISSPKQTCLFLYSFMWTPTSKCTTYLRNRISCDHNFWDTCVKWYLQAFFSFF